MILRGIDFGSCLLASGSLNFFGDGWNYDSWFKISVPGFKKALATTTFVAKTTTLYEKTGNMPLKKNLRPKEFKPRCIKVYYLNNMMLNAVGLSGPGAANLFKRGEWQKITKPFFISFMAVAATKAQRLDETKKFVDLFSYYLPSLKAKVGLQINISCPNTVHDTKELAGEAVKILALASELKIPLDLKVNIFMKAEILLEVQASGYCDVITTSNTIPFGQEPDIDWQELFGTTISPLVHLGGGGLSGKPIFPFVIKHIIKLRQQGISMPIKGSGGIMSVDCVDIMKQAGADAIEIGSVLLLDPWKVSDIVKRAEEIF